MSHDVTTLLAGYLAGVVVGTVISISIYRFLIETGKLRSFGGFGGDKQAGVQAGVQAGGVQ